MGTPENGLQTRCPTTNSFPISEIQGRDDGSEQAGKKESGSASVKPAGEEAFSHRVEKRAHHVQVRLAILFAPFVVQRAIPDFARWLVAAASSSITIIVLYEFLVRRNNVMRFLLGMYTKPRAGVVVERAPFGQKSDKLIAG